jgi:hypothetical protein
LIVSGDVVLEDDSSLIIDVNPPYAQAGVDYDQFLVGGKLTLNNPTLELNGADQLATSVNPIFLVELTGPFVVQGSFDTNAGALSIQNGELTAEFGLFRGELRFDGGDGNDIVISQLSVLPPVLPTTFRLQPLRIPVFTRTDAPPPVVQVPPVLATTAIAPLIEPDVTPVGVRYLEIRIVIPIDEAGNVREEFAFKLPAEWLANLPAVLRRLPDDRYRIYLMLEGGNEERLVMDVFVRDGRPIEPADTQPEAEQTIPDLPAAAPAPANIHESRPRHDLDPLPAPAGFAHPPDNTPEELVEPGRGPALGPATSGMSPAHGRLFVGSAAAVAAVVAARRTSNRWADEVDATAECIGQTASVPGWRWWRLASRGVAPTGS